MKNLNKEIVYIILDEELVHLSLLSENFFEKTDFLTFNDSDFYETFQKLVTKLQKKRPDLVRHEEGYCSTL